jgi:streptogramin lyase
MMFNKKLWASILCVYCVLVLIQLMGCTTITPTNTLATSTTTANYSGPGNLGQKPVFYAITAGPASYLWFTESNANEILRIFPKTGSITYIPTPGVASIDIISGSNSDLWFTEYGGIGEISSQTGTITGNDIPTTVCRCYTITSVANS